MNRFLGALYSIALSFSPCALARAYSNELMLFVYPASLEVDWSTPQTALRTSVFSSLLHYQDNGGRVNRSMVGHAIIHYRCTRSNGSQRDIWTGITGQNDLAEDFEDLTKKKVGLGILFKDYRDGEIQFQPNISRNKIANYYGRVEANGAGKREQVSPLFLRVPITSSDCDRVDNYHEFLKSISYDGVSPRKNLQAQPDSKTLFFGFNFREPHLLYQARMAGKSPRVGTGCTALAVSFLKLVKKFDPILESAWTVNVNVSHKLMGEVDPETGIKRDVTLNDLIFTKLGSSWEHPGWPSRHLAFYDTERMWDFLDGVRNCADGRKKNCTPLVQKWMKKQASNIVLHDSYAVLGDRRSNRRTIGRPGSVKTVLEDRKFQVWRNIEGITLE